MSAWTGQTDMLAWIGQTGQVSLIGTDGTSQQGEVSLNSSAWDWSARKVRLRHAHLDKSANTVQHGQVGLTGQP
jgi:hypothetical protein